MFIYNISLFFLFWTLQQFFNFNFKTIYSFSDIKFNYFYVSSFTIILLSIAGVPPFLGFFAKLFILIALTNSNFFFFYIFFFALLFFGLYFYMQNIRFLYSTNNGKINYAHDLNLRVIPLFIYYSYFALFLLTFGFLVFDDIILYFTWLIS